MWEDPIIKETHELRKLYAKTLNFDINLIFDDIQNRQKESDRKQVSFPSRKPVAQKKSA